MQNDGHTLAGHFLTVAVFPHQGFRCMSECFQTRQSQKAARPLDRVNQPENIAQNLHIVWFLLKLHKLNVNNVETFVGFSQEFAQKIVHISPLVQHAHLSTQPTSNPQQTGFRLIQQR